MKSYVVFPGGECRIVDNMPMPTYGPYDALVKVESCGVCNGTDMKIIHGAFKGVEDYPAVLGHEGVGRVVAMGEKVRSYKEGDLVLMPYWSDVPEGYSSAWGTYSEYNVVTDAAAMQADGLIPPDYAWAQLTLPGDFDPVSSAMIITFREVLSTMRLFDLKPGMSIAVVGLGPVGLCFVKMAKLMGLGPVMAIGRNEGKLKLAEAQGADVLINSSAEDPVQAVHKVCPEGIDVLLDAVGVPDYINIGLSMIKPGGKIAVYGISEASSANVDWSKCPYNWTLQFNQFPSKVGEGEAHRQIVSWIQAGVLNCSDYISHVFDFADIQQAFDRLHNGLPTQKMVIKF